MKAVRGFGAFLYDFVIGDDWVSAAGIVVALALTAGLAAVGVAAWWLLPLAVAALLTAGVRKGARA